MLEAHRVGDAEATACHAPQSSEMRATPKLSADVLCKDANVGAFAADHVEHSVRRIPRDQREFRNFDLARRACNLDAGAGVLVMIAPFELERRIGMGNLRQAP